MAVQPAVARAGAEPTIAARQDLSQPTGAVVSPQAGLQPDPMVRQAFDLLMSWYVFTPETGDVLNGGLDGAHHYLESRQVADPLAERPPFTGNRFDDWRLFLTAYGTVRTALGDKGSSEILDRAIVDGMARSLQERHTYYLPPEIFEQQMADLQDRNQYSGVGIQMSQEMVIMDVFEGSPAEAAGLRIGDQIIGVNGESIEGLTSTETSTRVRGEAGSEITLTIRRGGEAEPIMRTMKRATIAYSWLRSKILDDNIGYLQIRQFAIPDALPLFEQAMAKFAEADIRALIIDVRNNPGGAVATGEQIASRLIPSGRPIYQRQDRRSERTVTAWGEYWNREIPMVILTNDGSGSMSEILAAALQENGIAHVIGTRTAGAVAAGVPFPLVDGSGLVVTVEMITSPTGRTLNEVGLEPDQVVELDVAQFRTGKDTQLEAALAYIRERNAAPGRQGQLSPVQSAR